MKLPVKTCLVDTNVVLRYLLGDHPEFSPRADSFKSQILSALLKYEAANADIVDCILAATSTESRVVISFDSDMKKLKAVTESL